MRRSRTVLVVFVVLALSAGCAGPWTSQSAPAASNGTVTAVVDGDTIDVRLRDGTEERVRLLGIDTPEVHVETRPEHFAGVPNTTPARACLRAAGENASASLREQLAGERIRLDVDETADRRGDYGRLLAYVHHRGENVNYDLVVRGHAAVYPTEFRERARFEAAVREARAADRGLWRCRTP